MNLNSWKLAHASVIGTSHLAREIECQDCYDFRVLNTVEGEILVIVLADGAGSSERSQIGAQLACDLFIQQITIHFDSEGRLTDLGKDFGVLWIEYFRQKIDEQAAEENKSPREFACTFLAAVIGESGAVFYQVGDGAIVCSLNGDSEVYFFPLTPEKKIYANATNFITDGTAENHLLYDYIPEIIEDVAMFTDGVESFAVNYQMGTPHEPFLKPMFAPLRKENQIGKEISENLAKFLASPRINDKTDDDKTLFLASRFVPTLSHSTSEINGQTSDNLIPSIDNVGIPPIFVETSTIPKLKTQDASLSLVNSDEIPNKIHDTETSFKPQH